MTSMRKQTFLYIRNVNKEVFQLSNFRNEKVAMRKWPVRRHLLDHHLHADLTLCPSPLN